MATSRDGCELFARDCPCGQTQRGRTITYPPAVLGNFGSDNDHFVGVGAWNGDMTLGDWGVNVQSHAVWAVLDHNGDFAVVPEPGTLVLLAAAVIGLAGYGSWRR